MCLYSAYFVLLFCSNHSYTNLKMKAVNLSDLSELAIMAKGIQFNIQYDHNIHRKVIGQIIT